MTTACLISIGNELMSGRIVDSNAAYLSSQLLSVGIETLCSYTVGDDVDMIVEMLGQAASHADVVLVTGGIGPTDDDLTRHGLAAFMGVELEFREDVFKEMEEFFARRNITMAKTNRIQAYFPQGCKAITNEPGTAAGIMCEYEGTTIVCMPGVPSEMKKMFADSVLPMFGDNGVSVISRRLHCFGTGESVIAEMIGDAMERGRNPLVNCTVTGGIITLEIVARADCRKDAEKNAENMVRKLQKMLGKYVFGTDNETLAEIIGKKLRKNSKTIAIAESCTGGLLGKMLTDSSGASEYFKYGWVTYSNEAKVSQLGVEKSLIESYGAVSEEVAMAMSEGARLKSGADIAVAITGIAGPSGGNEQKPVGTVYISINAGEKGRTCKRYVFGRSRESVRIRAALTALDMVRSMLFI